jgi:hypothetical protein
MQDCQSRAYIGRGREARIRCKLFLSLSFNTGGVTMIRVASNLARPLFVQVDESPWAVKHDGTPFTPAALTLFANEQRAPGRFFGFPRKPERMHHAGAVD